MNILSFHTHKLLISAKDDLFSYLIRTFAILKNIQSIMTQNSKNSTVIMRMTCAIFFLLFTFIYLYDYQADVMAVTQYVLSKGATHYNRTIGAMLITLVLWLLQLAIYATTKLSRQTHALTFFPSMLLLAILTDITPHIDTENYLGNWIWGYPVILIFFAGVVWVCRQLESLDFPINNFNLFSRLEWINLLTMVIMSVGVCLIGSTYKVFHYRMNIEEKMIKGAYENVMNVGVKAEETDSSLTMLRAWAMAENQSLGENLFEYPLVGHSDALLPNGSSVKLMMASEKQLYKKFGVVFIEKMPPRIYFEKLQHSRWATPVAKDWLLCAYLLDCDLEKFAHTIGKYYDLRGNLPKHYREALILYTHLKSHPYIVYHNTVMDADYEDYLELARKYPNPKECYTVLRDSYGKTYWFYYENNKEQGQQRNAQFHALVQGKNKTFERKFALSSEFK